MRYGASKNFKSLFLYIERDHDIGDSNQLTIPRPEIYSAHHYCLGGITYNLTTFTNCG